MIINCSQREREEFKEFLSLQSLEPIPIIVNGHKYYGVSEVEAVKMEWNRLAIKWLTRGSFLLLMLLFTLPMVGENKQTQIDILVQVAEAQQKQLDSLVDTLRDQDEKLRKLSERLDVLEKRPKMLDSDPHTNGCYRWLSDGGREAIPCPLKKEVK